MIYPIILHHDKSIDHTKRLELSIMGREYDVIDSSYLKTTFTQSFNIAIIKAFPKLASGEYSHVMICNNDIALDATQIATLEDQIGSLDGVFSPSVNSPHSSVMSPKGAEVLREVPWVEFICPIISYNVMDAIGILDNNILLGWGVELDYCYRAKLAGFNTYLAQHVRVQHYEHRSQENHSDYSSRANLEMNHVLNNKYGPGWTGLLSYPQW